MTDSVYWTLWGTLLVTLVGWWLFGEVLSSRRIVGIALIIAGILELGT